MTTNPLFSIRTFLSPSDLRISGVFHSQLQITWWYFCFSFNTYSSSLSSCLDSTVTILSSLCQHCMIGSFCLCSAVSFNHLMLSHFCLSYTQDEFNCNFICHYTSSVVFILKHTDGADLAGLAALHLKELESAPGTCTHALQLCSVSHSVSYESNLWIYFQLYWTQRSDLNLCEL